LGRPAVALPPVPRRFASAESFRLFEGIDGPRWRFYAFGEEALMNSPRIRPTRRDPWNGLGIPLLLTLLALMLLGVLGAGAQSGPRQLRLLKRVALPQARSVATDIRWAGDDSVYVSWDRAGVVEVGLDGVKRRTLIPDLTTLGNGDNHYRHLAVSPAALAVASSNWGVVWRSLQPNSDGKVLMQSRDIPLINAFDLAGDRALFIGLAEFKADKEGSPPEFAPRGDVAWTGSLSSQLKDLQPVLYDAGGVGAPNYFNCRAASVGAVRFLAGGSFIVAPGFQDGIHLYDAGGRQVRSWTNEQVGLDTHSACAKMTHADVVRFNSEAGWGPWLNSHHVLDGILPLPQGPGLLVRSWGQDGQAHWVLKVLQADGIKTYAVPLVGHRPSDRLHGDVRDGKIVLLLASGFPWSWDPANWPAEMFLMELPGA
jgi:hypothetical protein